MKTLNDLNLLERLNAAAGPWFKRLQALGLWLAGVAGIFAVAGDNIEKLPAPQLAAVLQFLPVWFPVAVILCKFLAPVGLGIFGASATAVDPSKMPAQAPPLNPQDNAGSVQ